MAPSFEIGNPQRSLVRIPGSGEDKALKPICLDVAQINSFSKNLKEILHYDFNSSKEQPATGGTLYLAESLSTSFQRRNIEASTFQGRNVDTPTALQTCSIDAVTAPVGDNAGPSPLAQHSKKRKREFEEDNEEKPQSKRPASDSLAQKRKILTPGEYELMKQVISENEKLKKLNLELNKKIAMFKDIITNPRKLNEFLKVMEQLAC